MKRRLFTAAAVLLFSFAGASAQTAGDLIFNSSGASMHRSPYQFEGLMIEPNGQFIDESVFVYKIEKAVQLLKNKSPEEFKTMQAVIGKIRATRASGANYNEEIMTIEIASRTFEASLEWLASVLIHETRHIKKYRDTGKKYGGAFQMSDKKAALQVMIDEELDCNRIQLVVLEKIGGTKFEIDYLRAQKGDHFDIDKDGDYDWDDYNIRSWD